MTIEQLEEFFDTHPVPPDTMLNPATRIEDPKKFLEVNFDVVREWKGDPNKCPSYWHLCDLVGVVNGARGDADG